LKMAAFWGTDCYLSMGKYDECVRRYGILALRYQGTPEELIALSDVYTANVYSGQPDKAIAAVKRLQEALEKVPDAAFNGSLPTHKRDYWTKWLAEVTKPALPAAAI